MKYSLLKSGSEGHEMGELDMGLPSYEVEFIPLERRLNERRSYETEMIVRYGLSIIDGERRRVPDRRPAGSLGESFR